MLEQLVGELGDLSGLVFEIHAGKPYYDFQLWLLAPGATVWGAR